MLPTDHAPARPAFVIGITGHLDVSGDPDEIGEALASLFLFLKRGAGRTPNFFDRLPSPTHAPGLEQWPGLGETPILVLTTLAPGADSMAAEVALRPEFAALGFRVMAPLPFPARFFVHSSSFVKERAERSEMERQAQETFRRLHRRLGPDRCFPVWLAEDIPFPESDRFRRAAADCRAANSSARHRRYQAAGEYIATHCDLLVALWDDDYASGKAEGTEGIVRVKMRGVTPGLRAMANAFTWADCGSVVHFYMHRRSNPAPANPLKVGKLRWLHASELAQPDYRKMDVAPDSSDPLLMTWLLTPNDPPWRNYYEEWQTTGNLLLCRVATNLNAFNADFPPPAVGAKPLKEFFDDPVEPKSASQPDLLLPKLLKQSPNFFASLAPLSCAREHAARMSRDKLRGNSQRSLIAIIWLVFLFAVCIHLASHWHPQNEHGAARVSAGIAQESEHAPRNEEKAGPWIRVGFGLLALICAGGSLGHFERHRRDGVEERDQDYRALAEGLRVQIAWCVAGLSHAAAASYLQRQRNELDWLRSALSALHLPSSQWKRLFDTLDADLRLKLLGRVSKKWVNSQADYFERESKRQHSELHGWHKIGSILALGGVFLIAAFTALGLSGAIDDEGRFILWKWLDVGVDAMAAFGVLVLLGVMAQYLSYWKDAYLKARFGTPEKIKAAADAGHSDWWYLIQSSVRRQSTGSPYGITWKKWRETLAGSWFVGLTELVKQAIPSMHRPVHQTPGERRRQMIDTFLSHVWISVAFGVFLLSLEIALTRRFDWLPNSASLNFMVSGVCLVSGALLIAWCEKNLLSEHAYQYSTMASFFAAARERLDACLARAAIARKEDWAAAGRNHPNIVPPPTPPASPAVERHMREAQALIYDVGKEALSENGEWLILHRSRPMEPVMPG